MNAIIETPMADVNAWGWQGSSKTIRDRTTYMLSHCSIPFNVKFKVGLPGKKEAIIEAHKDILAIGSEVFYAMFYGGLATNEETIDITDTDPRAFRLLRRFLYTDELHTALMEKDIALAFEVMKCAGKYGVPYLYNRCRQWTLQHFVEHFKEEENVKTDALPYLQMALETKYEDQNTQEALWSEIDVCGESVLLTPDDVLRDITLDVLKTFLARDSLTVKEKNVYDFMIRWAKLQTREGDTAVAAGPVLRERLGDAIREVRYTQMLQSEFSSGPVMDDVLTFEEAVQVYRHEFAPVAEEEFRLVSRARKSHPSPTLLDIVVRVFEGGVFGDVFEFLPFAVFTIQMAELQPARMSYLKTMGSNLNCTWSCAEHPNSNFTTLTACTTFNSATEMYPWVDNDDLRVLKESVGQVVNLGLGDVAMEVAFTEKEDADHRTETISFIFGGYSRSTYTSDSLNNSVFYLGRIVSGPTDFSFMRHFIPGNFLPVRAGLCFSTKYSEDGE